LLTLSLDGLRLPLLKRSCRLLLGFHSVFAGSSLCRALGVSLLLSRDGLNQHSLLGGLLLRF
jgi:hypothetical protein